MQNQDGPIIGGLMQYNQAKYTYETLLPRYITTKESGIRDNAKAGFGKLSSLCAFASSSLRNLHDCICPVWRCLGAGEIQWRLHPGARHGSSGQYLLWPGKTAASGITLPRSLNFNSPLYSTYVLYVRYSKQTLPELRSHVRRTTAPRSSGEDQVNAFATRSSPTMLTRRFVAKKRLRETWIIGNGKHCGQTVSTTMRETLLSVLPNSRNSPFFFNYSRICHGIDWTMITSVQTGPRKPS